MSEWSSIMSIRNLGSLLLCMFVVPGVSSCVKSSEVRRVEPRGTVAMYGTYNDPKNYAVLTCGLQMDSLWTGDQCFKTYDEDLKHSDPIDRLHSIFMESIEFHDLGINEKKTLTENDIRTAACTGGVVASCTLADLYTANCSPFYTDVIAYDLSNKDNNEGIRPDEYDPRKLKLFRIATLKSLKRSIGYFEDCSPQDRTNL